MSQEELMPTSDVSPEAQLEKYRTEIEKYLKPPYKFGLPSTTKKLMPGDPDYGYYMCQSNVIEGTIGEIELLLSDLEVTLEFEQEERLKKICSEVKSLSTDDSKEYHPRTEEDMKKIKSLFEEAVTLLGGNIPEEVKTRTAGGGN
jgi:hypothetical protein